MCAVLACCGQSAAKEGNCSQSASVCFHASEGSTSLVLNETPVRVLIDENADPAVVNVAKNFVEDLYRVSGRKSKLLTHPPKGQEAIILIGDVEHSPLLKSLVDQGKLDVEPLLGQWEAFQVTTVRQPWPGVDKVIVVAGSDRRGAVFGTYDLSSQMGISPWHYFADVSVDKRKNVYLTSGKRIEKPSVRYRGIFINDEDPALSSWAQQQFGGVNSQMYEHVFELLLRLKGNYIWPAMWAPKSFHLDDPKSAVIANEMGIIMGSSHHEPLTRAQSEWHRLEEEYGGGEWNYASNSDNLKRFWRDALKRMQKGANNISFENLLTVGMRGDGDAPMSEGTAISLLEKIVHDQRQLIEEVTGKLAKETPQIWALYKEVQDYYDQGMTVPDDVTLLFADDNWGQIRRLPTKNIDREGGFGVYYHFDYVGVPRNYKWLNTTQIEKVWQQMNLAYERRARQVWIVNVGDIKPMEFPLSFFMDLAWDPEAMSVQDLKNYPVEWARKQFDHTQADEIAYLISQYSYLASHRKPELLNEDSYELGEMRRDSLIEGEWSHVIKEWRDLVVKLEQVKAKVRPEDEAAFFEIVEFPIRAFANLHELYFATAWNRRLASHFDPRGNVFLGDARQAFDMDKALTDKYHSMLEGKWDGMMSQVHMSYTIWNDPTHQNMPPVIYTAGDIPEKMRNAKASFAPSERVGFYREIGAGDFQRSHSASDLSWVAIDNLGKVKKSSIVAIPQGRPPTNPDKAPNVEYDIQIPEEMTLDVKVILSPTLNTVGGTELRVGASLDDGPVRILRVDLEPTGGATDTMEKQAWSNAMIEHQIELDVVFENVEAGDHAFKIWRLDDNVIVDGLRLSQR